VNKAELNTLTILRNAEHPLQPRDIVAYSECAGASHKGIGAINFEELYKALEVLEKKEYVISMKYERTGLGLMRRYYKITQRGRKAWTVHTMGIKR